MIRSNFLWKYFPRIMRKIQQFLSLPSLASHTFITGSTGTGKSNTVYQLLAQAREKELNFWL